MKEQKKPQMPGQNPGREKTEQPQRKQEHGQKPMPEKKWHEGGR